MGSLVIQHEQLDHSHRLAFLCQEGDDAAVHIARVELDIQLRKSGIGLERESQRDSDRVPFAHPNPIHDKKKKKGN